MCNLPSDLPMQPKIDDARYGEGCNRRHLRIQLCKNCGQFRHPPSRTCPNCRSTAREWVQSNGEGVISGFTWVSHPPHAALRDFTPSNVIMVELNDAPRGRIMSNLVDAGDEEIRIGMPVSIVWEHMGDDVLLPRFRPRGCSS